MAAPYWPGSGVPFQLLDYVSSTQALSLVPGGNTVLLNVGSPPSPPTPGYTVSKILGNDGTPGTNGLEWTVGTNGESALTNAFTVNTGHLYRISVFLDQAQNNDTTNSTTRIKITQAGDSTQTLVSLYAVNNQTINSSDPIQGAQPLQVVFVPLFSSIQIYATNTSSTDTSLIVLNNGKAVSYLGVGFILEDMGEAP
jgi:hypothetical protein